MRASTCSLALTLLVSACSLPPTQESSPSRPNPNAWQMGGGPGNPVLYGRDGSPVGERQPEAVQTASGPLNHGPQTDETAGSRVVMLELYQQAVEDRERLNEELEWADLELDKAYAAAEALETRLAEMQTALEQARLDKASAEERTFELAERLATAQLRRLESEKQLLEERIAGAASQ